jgi:hypothetical protein
MPSVITEEALAKICADTASAAGSAVSWLERNREAIGTKYAGLRRDFRRREMLARRYERASHRPVCVGVFGPSQAGKSYLVSALARKESAALTILLDRDYDFLSEINPEEGEEATGLVSRFSIKPSGAPADFPVCVRLLNQIEIIKILSNTYFLDFDATEERPPEAGELEAAFAQAEPLAQKTPVGVLTDVDIDDLRRYFDTQFASKQTVKVLNDSGYWTRLENLAPRLRIEDRIRLYSFLWGGLEQFNQVYRQIYSTLESLGFPDEAFCAIEALRPRETSIINVKALNGILDSGGDVVKVRSPSGVVRDIPRPHLTAIVAELVVQIKEHPWPFFDHTDLLDFPGARTREINYDPQNFVKKPFAVADLFRRGKVAYLFDRYCEDNELSSMLLCLPPGNQEVRTLPGLMATWIRSAQGSSSAERAKQQTALFVVLTKFDRRFEVALGTAGLNSNERWTAALKTPLTDFFRTSADNWAQEWHPGQPFNNVFWLRNPNFIAKGLMRYAKVKETVKGQEKIVEREDGLADPAEIETIKQEYLENEYVKRHVQDPERAWNEAFRLNDGGITFLADSIAPVCRPELKREQVLARISTVRSEMQAALAEFHVSDDRDAEKAKRKQAAREAILGLRDTMRQQRFGHLLSQFQVSNEELQLLFRRKSAAGDVTDGTGPDVDVMLKELGIDDGETTKEPTTIQDKYFILAKAAIGHWTERIQQLAQRPKTLEFLKVAPSPVEVIVRELLEGADRIDLCGTIARDMRAIAPAIERSNDESMLKPSMAAAERIDRYVWKLNQDALEPQDRVRVEGTKEIVFKETPPVDEITDLPQNRGAFFQPFIRDWLASFGALTASNAEGDAKRKFPVEDSIALQKIMTSLAAA